MNGHANKKAHIFSCQFHTFLAGRAATGVEKLGKILLEDGSPRRGAGGRKGLGGRRRRGGRRDAEGLGGLKGGRLGAGIGVPRGPHRHRGVRHGVRGHRPASPSTNCGAGFGGSEQGKSV